MGLEVMSRSKSLNGWPLSVLRAEHRRTFERHFCLQVLVARCETAQHGSAGIAPVTSDALMQASMVGLALSWDAFLVLCHVQRFLGVLDWKKSSLGQ